MTKRADTAPVTRAGWYWGEGNGKFCSGARVLKSIEDFVGEITITSQSKEISPAIPIARFW